MFAEVPIEVTSALNRFLSRFLLSDIVEELSSYGLSVVALLGPPASGKDTLLSNLDKEVVVFGSGDYFRNPKNFSFASQDVADDLFLIADFFLNKNGLLLPEKVTVTAFAFELLHRLKNNTLDPNSVFVCNGWPRTMSQLELLSSFVMLKKVFWLDVPRKQCLLQSKKRFFQTAREDDVLFEKRFALYEEHTLPVKERLESNQDVEVIHLSLPLTKNFSLKRYL